MVLITFVRHGETDFNKNGILQGHLNIPLNAKGRQQAVMVGERLRQDHTHVDMVVSSDLDRAYETASIIVDQLANKPTRSIITTPLLRERYLGKLEGVDLRQFVNWEELPEAKKMIQLQNILSQKSNINSIITPNPTSSAAVAADSLTMQTPSSSSPSGKLSSANILKHLPQKELKLESKHKLIKRAKEAFQFILKQVPQKLLTTITTTATSSSSVDEIGIAPQIIPTTAIATEIPNQSPLSSSHSSLSTSSTSSQSSLSSSSSSASSISSNENSNPNTLEIKELSLNDNSSNNNNSNINTKKQNNSPKEFHILVVSHSLTLKTILSLLLCKRPPISVFCNNNVSDDITQSEQSSHQNFKWIQLDLKNASIVRTSFSLIEKKSGDDHKRLPRDIIFYPVATVDEES